MSFRYLDYLATADVAFEATGDTLTEVFRSASEATVQTMVESLETIRPRVRRFVELQEEEVDLLLFDFLQEFIYYKDSELLLLKAVEMDIQKKDGLFCLQAILAGETIDLERHLQGTDVKAVTLHQFILEQKDSGWRAQVILDV